MLRKLLGIAMIVWYAAIRWTWFADRTIYSWAYAPINIMTAFLSILFLFVSMCYPSYGAPWMIILAAFLAFRNFYYTAEDIIDLPHSVPQQLIFIAIDLAMLVYCQLYLRRHLRHDD